MATTAVKLTVDEVGRRLDRGEAVTFLDSRNPIAWGASRVKLPGAIRVPVDEVDRHVATLPPERLLVAYCT